MKDSILRSRRAMSKAAAATVTIIIIIAVIAGAWYYYTTTTPPATTTSSTTTTTTTTSTTTSTTTTTTTTTTSSTTAPPPTSSTTTTTTTVSKPPIHETVLYLIQNDASSRVLTIKKGVADLGVIPADQLNALVGTKRGDFQIIQQRMGLSFDITYIVLNTLKPPFNNVLVRQALAFATPYPLIWKTIYANTMAPLVGVIPKGMMGWTTYNTINYTFDMAKAKALIAKSGIDPSKYVITVYYNQGNTNRAKLATMLSTYWGQLGFKVAVQALSWPQLLEKTSKPEFDVYIIGWAPDYADPDDYAGPLVGGGTNFDTVKAFEVTSASDVSNYLSSAKVIDTPNYYVVVGPEGKGASVSLTGKKIVVVQYKLSEKQTPPANCTAFVTIDPAFYRNVTLDALIEAGRYSVDPNIRTAIYQAVEIISNYEVPNIWLGQNEIVRDYWNWVKGRYYNPVLAERWDLIYEVPIPNPPSVGIGNYINDEHTLVISTIGWPQSFDPAKSYETFGWEIFHEIGDTLVTYWKDDLTHAIPDASVAWAHNANGTEWYFVIRGGLKAYDPSSGKIYTVNATDVLFTIWRIARLGLDPSWMITTFFDVNGSKAYTESEFNNILSKGGLYATYNGKTVEVKSLDQLLQIFGYKGETAGVVMLKLYKPYGAILNILADPFTMVIPAKYLFDNVQSLQGKYMEAMQAAQWGKNPSAWAKYIGTGDKEPTHMFLHNHPIGTGPYYVADFKQDSYIVLKLNPQYWNMTLWQQLYNYKP